MRKTFVIDTNVLLHDPDAICKFRDNDVVLSLGVLEELDKLKRLSDELGKNARQVIRYIDTLRSSYPGELSQGVKIENGVIVRLLIADPKLEKQKGFMLSLDLSNRILYVAYQLKMKGEPVVIVSKDFLIRLKAEAIGVEAEDYENLKVS